MPSILTLRGNLSFMLPWNLALKTGDRMESTSLCAGISAPSTTKVTSGGHRDSPVSRSLWRSWEMLGGGGAETKQLLVFGGEPSSSSRTSTV